MYNYYTTHVHLRREMVVPLETVFKTHSADIPYTTSNPQCCHTHCLTINTTMADLGALSEQRERMVLTRKPWVSRYSSSPSKPSPANSTHQVSTVYTWFNNIWSTVCVQNWCGQLWLPLGFMWLTSIPRTSAWKMLTFRWFELINSKA